MNEYEAAIYTDRRERENARYNHRYATDPVFRAYRLAMAKRCVDPEKARLAKSRHEARRVRDRSRPVCACPLLWGIDPKVCGRGLHYL